MIVGIGIDIVELPRIADAVAKHGQRFLSKLFTEDEIAYCRSRSMPTQHYAGRFAAKEALLKAIGTGWRKGVSWKDIEIRNDSYGLPMAHITGGVAERARQMGVRAVHLTISHCQTHAVAQVVLEGDAPGPEPR